MAGAAFAAPMHSSVNIFPPQGEEHCHGSSIVELPSGDLLAAWFQGHGERSANDVRILGSRLKKGATAWSPVFLMADSPDLPDCNSVLYVDSRGTLWLFWIRVVANRWENSMLMYRRTTDMSGDAAPNWQWQDVITLKPKENFVEDMKAKLEEARVDTGMWAEYALPYSELLVEAAADPRKQQTGWMTRIHPIELPSGRMVLPLYHDGFNAGLVGISDDGGNLWRAGGGIFGAGPIQPTICRKTDGTLVAYCRDSGGAPNRVMVSESTDNGESWTVCKDTDIPNSGSSLEANVLKDGTWAMIYNDTERGRHRLAVRLSDDEGKTWKWERHLVQAKLGEGGYAYPSMMQAKDGTIHATYSNHPSRTGRTIEHATFNVEWVKQGGRPKNLWKTADRPAQAR